MLVDSHCHLDFPDFADDLDGVIARAKEAGVERMLTICTAPSRFEKNLAIARRFEEVFCAVGVHPHQAAEEGEISVDALVDLGGSEKTVGMGETGLDYFYDNSPREVQADSFRRHCQAARRLDMPIIIHTREAEEDTVRILEEEAARPDGGHRLRGVLHCFSGSRWLANKGQDLGFYISLSGIYTFKKSDALREAVADVPLDKLLVETDAPFLAPVPKRGKRNEPSYVAHTAAFLAHERGLPVEEVAQATTANFFALFNRATAPEPLAVTEAV